MHFKCEQTYQLPLSSEFGNTLEVDPERVFEIQYVHAGVGDAIESRFGHAMFRIVQCAPHRSSLGTDCRRDNAYHAVLSFRARTQGETPGIFNGLVGAYPLELGVLRPSEVQDTYLETEMRSIEWLPLKMNRTQIRRFVQRSAEIAWSVEGDYKFLTRNCADDAVRLLAVSFQDSTLIHPGTDVMSPSGLRDFLIEKRLVDPLGARKSEPVDQSLKIFFQRLKRAMGKLPMELPLRDYLLHSSARFRSKVLQEILHELDESRLAGRMSEELDARLGLEAWLVIEPYCNRVIERKLLVAWRANHKERIQNGMAHYYDIYVQERKKRGYGIPVRGSPKQLELEPMNFLTQEELATAKTWVRENQPKQVSEMEISAEASAIGRAHLLQSRGKDSERGL